MSKRRAVILLLFFFTGIFAVYRTLQQAVGEEDTVHGEDLNGRWEVICQTGLAAVFPFFVMALLLTIITIQGG